MAVKKKNKKPSANNTLNNKKTKSGTNVKTKPHPVSGSEPNTANYTWYNDPLEVLRHNCMSFAFGTRMPRNAPVGHKQQPGNLSRKPNHVGLSSCKNIVDTVLDDYPDTVYKLNNPYMKCKKQYSKVILALAKDRDFHFYRQEKDGYWKHKRGLSRVSSVDACGKKIKDPLESCSDYGSGLDYSTTCTGFCTKRTPHNKNGKNGKNNGRKSDRKSDPKNGEIPQNNKSNNNSNNKSNNKTTNKSKKSRETTKK